jgi:hypothetical protein
MTMFAGLNVGFKRSGWGRQECLAGSCRHPSGGDRGGAAGVGGPSLFRQLGDSPRALQRGVVGPMPVNRAHGCSPSI